MIAPIVAAARSGEKARIAGATAGLAGLVKLEALRPVDLDRRHRHEQRPRKIARRSDLRLRHRLLDRKHGETLGQERRRDRHVFQEIDGAADGGAQALGGKAGDLVDTGLARRQRRPVVLPARPQRGHDANSRHHDDGAALMIEICVTHTCSIPLLASSLNRRSGAAIGRRRPGQSSAAITASDSPRQWPQPVTAILSGAVTAGFSKPDSSKGR